MVLADTSVWIDFFRKGNNHLKQLLLDAAIYMHPWIIGELASGHLHARQEILGFLVFLPQAKVVSQEELLFFIEKRKLYGMGMGLVDIQLLASANLSGLKLWTRDINLQKVSSNLDLFYDSKLE